MEANQILNANILDVIFEGRNKDYGAYELRKKYNKRLKIAIVTTLSICVLLLVGLYVAGSIGKSPGIRPTMLEEVDLKSVDEPKKDVIPPSPKVQPRVAMERFTTLRIVKDQDAKKEDKPPEQEKLEDTKIGAVTQEGQKDDGITAPPADPGKGVVESPKEDDDAPFTKVEVESLFIGGEAAWARFLHKNLNFPDEAVTNEIQGTVMVKFVVDKDGNVSDVQAESGPTEGGLRNEAMRVIKKSSGMWTAAIQNGRHVKSYKRQPILFRLQDPSVSQ